MSCISWHDERWPAQSVSLEAFRAVLDAVISLIEKNTDDERWGSVEKPKKQEDDPKSPKKKTGRVPISSKSSNAQEGLGTGSEQSKVRRLVFWAIVLPLTASSKPKLKVLRRR